MTYQEIKFKPVLLINRNDNETGEMDLFFNSILFLLFTNSNIFALKINKQINQNNSFNQTNTFCTNCYG